MARRGCPSVATSAKCVRSARYIARDAGTPSTSRRFQEAGYSTAFLIDDNAAANSPRSRTPSHGDEARFAGMLVTQIRRRSLHQDGRLDKELLKLLKRAASVTVVCVGSSRPTTRSRAAPQGIDSSRMAKALKAMRRYGCSSRISSHLPKYA